MNMPDRVTPLDDDHGIDLLVDGELDDKRRRELLLRLESVPGGWRRCALAFLEAQAWRQESQTVLMKPQPAIAVTAPMSMGPVARNLLWRGAWGNLLAVAASFGVAFALGAWYRSGGEGMNNASILGGGPLAQSTQSADDVKTDDAWMGPDGYVTLLMDGVADGESKQLRLPVHTINGAFDPALVSQPLKLPSELLEQIERSGQTVRHQRQFVPLSLQDGRRMIVPMDEMQIVPVARTFQ